MFCRWSFGEGFFPSPELLCFRAENCRCGGGVRSQMVEFQGVKTTVLTCVFWRFFMEMKCLNNMAQDVFAKMIAKLDDGYLKLDSNRGFMPTIVEEIGNVDGYGKLFSVAHCGEMNGDLMRDSDVTFVEKDGKFYPVLFRNDYLGIDQEVFTYKDGSVSAINYRWAGCGTSTNNRNYESKRSIQYKGVLELFAIFLKSFSKHLFCWYRF